MVEGYEMEFLPDGECGISDCIHAIKHGFYRNLDVAVMTASNCICSGLYLSDDEEEFLIRFLFNATGVRYGS